MHTSAHSAACHEPRGWAQCARVRSYMHTQVHTRTRAHASGRTRQMCVHMTNLTDPSPTPVFMSSSNTGSDAEAQAVMRKLLCKVHRFYSFCLPGGWAAYSVGAQAGGQHTQRGQAHIEHKV